MRSFLSTTTLTLVAVLSGSGVAAAAPPEPPPQTLEAADELYRKGNALYDEGKFKEAYEAYIAAWERKKSFDIAGNLGDVELILDKPREAAEHLAHSLRTFPPNGRPEAREKTRKRLEEAKQRVGTLNLRVNVARAQIRIDGKPMAVSPVDREIFVEAGTRTITAELEGHETASQTVSIEKGASRDVQLDLVPRDSTSGGTKPEGPNGYVIAGGIAGTVVLAGLGIGFLVHSSGRGDDRQTQLHSIGGNTQCRADSTFKPDSPECIEISDASADERTFMGLGIASFIGSGLALGGTLAYAFWPRHTSSTSRGTRIIPRVGAGFVGAQAVGSF